MTRLRSLKPEEFHLLDSVGDGMKPPLPELAIAIVAEDEGKIVGRVFVVQLPHVEGIWVDDDKRGGLLLAKLMAAAELEAMSAGIKELLAFGIESTDGLLDRMGYDLKPWTIRSKELT